MSRAVTVNLGGGGRAAFLFLAFAAMSFSYGPTSSPATINPQIDYIRGLVFDTQQFNAAGAPIFIWNDEEILMYEQLQTQTFQSGQFYSFTGGRFVPPVPIDYYRVAGVMLMALAANKAKLASVQQLLDVKLDASKAAAALNDQGQAYLDLSDNSGAFAIIEQVNDYWSFSDRFWKQVQRQQGV